MKRCLNVILGILGLLLAGLIFIVGFLLTFLSRKPDHERGA